MWCIVTGLIWMVLSAATLTQGLFLRDEAYTYNYNAIVQTVALKPSQTASYWRLRCSLYIQSNGTKALLQLQNCSTSLHNGIADEEQKNKLREILLPVESHHLEKPFLVYYEGGYSQSVKIFAGEPLWAINIKRSLASILQMDLSKLKDTIAKVEEHTLRGKCPVEYLIDNEGNNVTVWKFFDHQEQCISESPIFYWTNIPPMICDETPQTLTSFSKWVYTLEKVNADAHRLLNLNAIGTISFQTFPPDGELQYILVNQSFHLQAIEDKQRAWKQKGKLKNVGLTFEASLSDFTQDRDKPRQEYTLKKIDILMEKLTESLETPPSSLPLDKLHQVYVPYILQLLRSLDKSGLEIHYSELAIGTSYQQETKRNFFLELLPKVGTEASVLFIRDLVLGCKVKEESALKLLTYFPFHVREPSEHLLQECEVLLSPGDDKSIRIKHTAVLSFSNLIYNICPKKCSPAKYDLYIRQFVDLFTSSTSYSEQMLYVEALNNIELGNTFNYVLPIIKGNVTTLSEKPHHIRFLGVWATMNTAPYHPQETYELYWPIFTNHSEHLQMRVAALTMLIVSGASTGRFFSLYWYMQTEPSRHLQHFFYTTVLSLSDSQYPCYSYMKPVASLMVQYLTPPKKRTWFTGNYIMDYTDSEHKFGGLAQLFAVGNERTSGPNVLYLQLSNYALGKVLSNTALYLKIEGVEESVKQEFTKMYTETQALPHLAELIRKLKPSSATKEPVHIEIIAKIHGRVIFCTYINDTTYHQQLEAIRRLDILNQEFHINYQSADAPLSFQSLQPTDLGTPAVLSFDSAALLSFRGNFTMDHSAPLTRKNQFDLRYSVTLGGSLNAYNPINNLWHATRRSFTYQLHIPMSNWFTVMHGLNHWSFKLGIIKPAGSVMSTVAHLRRATIVLGENSEQQLTESCTSCKIIEDVSASNNNYNKELPVIMWSDTTGSQLKLFPHLCRNTFASNMWIILRAFQNVKKNFQILPFAESVAEMLHHISYSILLSETNSCGIKAELASIINKDTELVLSVHQTNEKGRHSKPEKFITHYTLTNKFVNEKKSNIAILKQWDITVGIEHIPGSYKYGFRTKVLVTVMDKREKTACIDGEVLTPAADTHELLQTSPSEEVTSQIKFIFGHSDGSKCPTEGLTLNVNMSAKLLDEQLNLARNANVWPYSQCALEKQQLGLKWGNQTPLTEACYRSSVALGTLRKYTLSVTHASVDTNTTDVPKTNHPWAEKLLSLIPNSDEATLSLEVPDGPSTHVILSLNKEDTYINGLRPLIEPWLINTHFPLSLQLGFKYGWIGSCVINSDLVNTLDNATHSILMPRCYTLAAADCYSKHRFAVFVKSIFETKTLAIKIYTRGYYVEIIPTTQKDLKISVNGEVISAKPGPYYHPPDSKLQDLKIILHENGLLELSSKATKIWLQYNGHFIAISIPALYSGQTCGLCGDFNGDSSNDIHELLSVPCEKEHEI